MKHEFYFNGYCVTVLQGNLLLEYEAMSYVAEQFCDGVASDVGQTACLFNSPFRGGVADYEQVLARDGIVKFGTAYVSKAMYGKRIIHSAVLGMDTTLPLEERGEMLKRAYHNIVLAAIAAGITDIIMPALATGKEYGSVGYQMSARCLMAALGMPHGKMRRPVNMTVVIHGDEDYAKFMQSMSKWHKVILCD